MSGWIKLHRSIQSHWLYTEKRVFSKYEAWNDILLTVNHNESKALIKGKIYIVKRGESILSFESWGKRWGWNKHRVRSFMQLLKNDGMIDYICDNITTHLTVCNYDNYQDESNAKTTQKQRRHNTGTTQTQPIKEEKEEKEYIYIPSLTEFLEYAKSECQRVGKDFDKYSYSITAKYEAWVEAKWRDGNGEKIKNWKTKIKNTLPYLKEFYQKEVRYAGNGIGGVL